MSGPTWLPPRTLDSPERAVPQMSGSAIYRAPNKKGMSDFRPKYGPYDQNGGGGGGGGGMTNRYMATGSTGKKTTSYILVSGMAVVQNKNISLDVLTLMTPK